MSEMIFGNNGQRDEGINIDMRDSLYNNLKPSVSVFKGLLRGGMVEHDMNYVYIGADHLTGGNRAVLGYNARLQSDDRGGNYGHYKEIAEELTPSKCFENMEFFSEDGYISFVNSRAKEGCETFAVCPYEFEISGNALKKIVNNLLMNFSETGGAEVSFSIDEENLELYSRKALYVLQQILSYLPHCMRKKVLFISRIKGNKTTGVNTNLIAYTASEGERKFNCINVNDDLCYIGDEKFAQYIEEIFSIKDMSEREAYLYDFYKQLEETECNKTENLYSEFYLYALKIKQEWSGSDLFQSIKSMLNVLRTSDSEYSICRESAQDILENDSLGVEQYITQQYSQRFNEEIFRILYSDLKELYNICGVPFVQMDDLFKQWFKHNIQVFDDENESMEIVRAIYNLNSLYIDQELCDMLLTKTNQSNFVIMSKEFFMMNRAVVNHDTVVACLKSFALDKKSIQDYLDIYNDFQYLMEKQIISESEIDECIREELLNLINSRIDSATNPTEMLARLEEMYSGTQWEKYTLPSSTYNEYKNHLQTVIKEEELAEVRANMQNLSADNDVSSEDIETPSWDKMNKTLTEYSENLKKFPELECDIEQFASYLINIINGALNEKLSQESLKNNKMSELRDMKKELCSRYPNLKSTIIVPAFSGVAQKIEEEENRRIYNRIMAKAQSLSIDDNMFFLHMRDIMSEIASAAHSLELNKIYSNLIKLLFERLENDDFEYIEFKEFIYGFKENELEFIEKKCKSRHLDTKLLKQFAYMIIHCPRLMDEVEKSKTYKARLSSTKKYLDEALDEGIEIDYMDSYLSAIICNAMKNNKGGYNKKAMCDYIDNLKDNSSVKYVLKSSVKRANYKLRQNTSDEYASEEHISEEHTLKENILKRSGSKQSRPEESRTKQSRQEESRAKPSRLEESRPQLSTPEEIRIEERRLKGEKRRNDRKKFLMLGGGIILVVTILASVASIFLVRNFFLNEEPENGIEQRNEENESSIIDIDDRENTDNR